MLDTKMNGYRSLFQSGVENIADHWSQKIFYAGRKKKGKEEKGGKKEKNERKKRKKEGKGKKEKRRKEKE